MATKRQRRSGASRNRKKLRSASPSAPRTAYSGVCADVSGEKSSEIEAVPASGTRKSEKISGFLEDFPPNTLEVPPVPKGVADPVATRDHLARLTELDAEAKKLLTDPATKTTAKAMILRERRELALAIAKVRGVDVEGKRPPEGAPDPDDERPKRRGLTLGLAKVKPETLDEVLTNNGGRIAIAEDEEQPN